MQRTVKFYVLCWGLGLAALSASFPAAYASETGWTEVPTRPPLALLQEDLDPPFRITALRLSVQEGAPLTQPWSMTAGENLAFDLKLQCLTAQWEQSPELQLEIYGEGPSIRESYALDTALCSSVGGSTAYSASYTVPRYRINGDVTLALKVRTPTDTRDTRENLLYLAPFHLQPAVLDSQIETAALEAVFGGNLVVLGKRFRLGNNARVTLPIPGELPFTPRRLGLVSRLEFSATHRAEEVFCNVELLDADGEVHHTVSLLNGIHSAFGNRNYYVPDTIPTQSPPVFEAWESSGANQADAPYKRQLYWSEVDLPEGPIPASLSFHYVKPEGLLEVRDVVLLP